MNTTSPARPLLPATPVPRGAGRVTEPTSMQCTSGALDFGLLQRMQTSLPIRLGGNGAQFYDNVVAARVVSATLVAKDEAVQ